LRKEGKLGYSGREPGRTPTSEQKNKTSELLKDACDWGELIHRRGGARSIVEGENFGSKTERNRNIKEEVSITVRPYFGIVGDIGSAKIKLLEG